MYRYFCCGGLLENSVLESNRYGTSNCVLTVRNDVKVLFRADWAHHLLLAWASSYSEAPSCILIAILEQGDRAPINCNQCIEAKKQHQCEFTKGLMKKIPEILYLCERCTVA